MSAGRPPSTQMAMRMRKRGSGKKRDQSLNSLVTRRGSLGSIQGDRYHRTSFPLVMDIPMCSDDALVRDDLMDTSPFSSTLLQYFPFQQLPDLCKFKVWSFLKQSDLGRSMLVCKEWYGMIKKPQLWNTIQFSSLPYSCLPHDCVGPVHTEPVCHHCFRKRVFSFGRFLTVIQPAVTRFQFCLDISHPSDKFMSVVELFINTARMSNLKNADINWKDSPSRQPIRGSQESSRDYVHRFRRRQRLFVQFFERFISLAPRLTTLVVPFDWSERSVSSLCLLKCLENLVLEKYGIYSTNFEQKFLDIILQDLCKLKKLLLEVWMPTCSGIKKFSIRSKSLTYLDVSQCRGFYLNCVKTPALEDLRIVRQIWNNSVVWQQLEPLPCVHDILASGAPKLKDINGQSLNADWAYQTTEPLNSQLSMICCCVNHIGSSSIEVQEVSMPRDMALLSLMILLARIERGKK